MTTPACHVKSEVSPAQHGVKAAITHFQREVNDEVPQRPLDFGLIRRLLEYTRPYARKRNWLILLVVMRAIQLPVLSWLIGRVVKTIEVAVKAPVAERDLASTFHWAVAFLALALTTQLSFHFRQRLALELGESVMQDLRRDIFQHLLRMPMSFFNRTKLGRMLSRITSDADAVRVGVQDVLFVSLVQGGQMFFAGLAILYYDWVMFLVLLAMVPALWMLNRHFRRKLSNANRAVQESFSRITSTLAESVNGIRVTQGFARQELNASFFRELVTDHSKYNLGVARASGVFLPLLELHGQLFTAVLLGLAGWQVITHRLPLGDMIMLGFLANLFLSPIPILGNLYNASLTAMAGAERVFKLLDEPPDWQDAAEAKPVTQLAGRVEFRQVTFSYIPDRLVLQEVSFNAEPGMTVALVGHTGSGKTTIANLIAKFYLTTAGQVLIDGHEINAITGDSLHRQMGIVNQNNFLFTGTVMENIRVGRPAAKDEEIIAVARQLDFLDMIGALPNGFNTQVGERGANLSLGQRQLVCFARAMLADPRILILDEATSSVDSLTEARLQRALALLLKGRTSFVVAHRLSTIRQADLVLVLDHGRIIERGTHAELLAAGGHYAALHKHFVQTAVDEL